MTKLDVSKIIVAILLLCLMPAIPVNAQVFTTLVYFNGLNGASPEYMHLIQSTDGNLYGTTEAGAGVSAYGTVFKVTPKGTLTTLYSFCIQTNCQDGAYPSAGLALGTDGNFYGTTYNGGKGNCVPRRPGCGTVFKITPTGKLTTLYTFCDLPSCTDGDSPFGPLFLGADGNFYGTTTQGGAFNNGCAGGCGTIYKITPHGVLTTLHSFENSDGYAPMGGVIQATDGNFYGTASDFTFANPIRNNSTFRAVGLSGCGACGTVFRITRGGAFTTLHHFTGTDGATPFGGLVQANDGGLYGTTYGGGNVNPACYLDNISGCGTVFRLGLNGHFKTLYDFCSQPNCDDGYYPIAGPIQATDGEFYGTTVGETNTGFGTVFAVSAGGSLTTLHVFDNADGAYPYNGLMQETNGTLYGATTFGGDQDGTVFSLSTGLGPFVAFVHASGRVGQTGPILGQGFTGTTSVILNGTPASFTVKSDTYIRATVPAGATTGYVTVTTPSGTLTSNVKFHVIQ